MDIFAWALFLVVCQGGGTQCEATRVALAVSPENCADLIPVYQVYVVTDDQHEGALVCQGPEPKVKGARI